MSESFKSEETRGVRFQKEGTEVNKEYVEGFSNLPKLSRTPNTDDCGAAPVSQPVTRHLFSQRNRHGPEAPRVKGVHLT